MRLPLFRDRVLAEPDDLVRLVFPQRGVVMRRYRISAVLFAAFLAGSTTGCQDGVGLLAPEAGPASIAAERSAGASAVQDRSSDVGGVTAVIDRSGGELKLGNQRLVVPAGAVDAPTIFRMKNGSGHLSVALTATRTAPNDVGSAGFPVPLILTFHYANEATLPGDPALLQIVWIRPDGSLEPQPTTVDLESKVISGEISHLSEYALASN